MQRHKVAITGVGIVSCLGVGAGEVAASLREGRSGIVVDEERQVLGFRSPLTGRLPEVFLERFLSRKQRKTMPDFAQNAYVAVREALDSSGLSEKDLQNPQSGLIFGCDSSCLAAVEQVDLLRQYGETHKLGSGLVFRAMTSAITMNLNVLLGTQGASWTLSSACSSSGHAIGQAADLIALGRQERVICGGAQEINWESVCSFDALGAFSTRIDDPAAASRPFDVDRDGLVPSGGAAALVLENYDLARQRGATILGEVRGYGFSSDGGTLSVPSSEGLARAMRAALVDAAIEPQDVTLLLAHATSTLAGDAAEAENIRSVFGLVTPHVSALKALTGHELWMAGAATAVYAVIMAQAGFMAPTINFTAPDATTSGLRLLNQTLPQKPERVLCNAAGFGGSNSSLLLDFSSP
ncbi:MAG: beta-ketoacyl-[acyl-carrier-protein] synthase family protein [Pseudomonadota bacterium]|nr:beta-ketoacyl-[acyl-carrier-protein] synthase family protein [Pseudomonadota bacterium]